MDVPEETGSRIDWQALVQHVVRYPRKTVLLSIISGGAT